MCEFHDHPQQGRNRLILPMPLGGTHEAILEGEKHVLDSLSPDTVMMMGDNPALPKVPEKPSLLDFFRTRVNGITRRHLLTSAHRAMEQGMPEKVVLAILLHDIAVACLIRADHGYWGAQMIAPYVDEEVAFGVQYHQCLRYYADEANGYPYPESYNRFFGPDYAPPDYIRADAEHARNHRFYLTARQVTVFDSYFFDETPAPDPEIFTDIIGRHFREPSQGLGFDQSPVAHMWRTVIWPHNAL